MPPSVHHVIHIAMSAQDPVSDRIDQAERIMTEISREAWDQIKKCYADIDEAQENIRAIKKAWEDWDLKALERLGLVSRRDSDFVQDVRGEVSWEVDDSLTYDAYRSSELNLR